MTSSDFRFILYKAYTTDSESVMPQSGFSPALSLSRRISLTSNDARVAPPTPQRPRIAPLRPQTRKTPPPIPPRLNELRPIKAASKVQSCDLSYRIIYDSYIMTHALWKIIS